MHPAIIARAAHIKADGFAAVGAAEAAAFDGEFAAAVAAHTKVDVGEGERLEIFRPDADPSRLVAAMNENDAPAGVGVEELNRTPQPIQRLPRRAAQRVHLHGLPNQRRRIGVHSSLLGRILGRILRGSCGCHRGVGVRGRRSVIRSAAGA